LGKLGKSGKIWENKRHSGKENDILGKKTTFWENVGKNWEMKIFPKSQVGKEN
jgi:acid phosphatase class B